MTAFGKEVHTLFSCSVARTPSLATFLRKDHTVPSPLCGWEIYYIFFKMVAVLRSHLPTLMRFFISRPPCSCGKCWWLFKKEFNQEHLSSVVTSNEQGQTSLEPAAKPLPGGYPCVPAAVTSNGHFRWKLMCFLNKTFCKRSPSNDSLCSRELERVTSEQIHNLNLKETDHLGEGGGITMCK